MHGKVVNMTKQRKQKFLRPTTADQQDFLLRLFFGRGDGNVARCVGRAYRDFNRTLRSKGHDRFKNVSDDARVLLIAAIKELAESRSPLKTQSAFDEWHEDLCTKLKDAYGAGGYSAFTVGQGQKWINMTLKYLYVFGEDRCPKYEQFYRFCHVPIDSIIVARLKEVNQGNLPPGIDGPAWSRIDDYSVYIGFQRWLRGAYEGSEPLAVEFALWQEKPLVND